MGLIVRLRNIIYLFHTATQKIIIGEGAVSWTCSKTGYKSTGYRQPMPERAWGDTIILDAGGSEDDDGTIEMHEWKPTPGAGGRPAPHRF